MADSHVFQAKALEHAIATIVAAGGSEPREAQLVSSNLVMANLSGHDSHGVGMIPRYIESLKEGGLQPNRHPQIKFDGDALLALDGHAGYGQVIGLEATDMAIARFGTNPCTIGIPLAGKPPMILDMATSAVAQGKIRVAHNKGVKVAPGLLIDDKGEPTLDPRYGVIEPLGALITMGLHKGYGLAVACELLGGALTGGGTQRTGERSKKRVLNGMLSILIDPAKLGTAEFFGIEAAAFIDWVKQSPPAAGFDKVRIAGDPERETRVKRVKDGIEVDATTWRGILAAAEKLELEAAQIDRLARG